MIRLASFNVENLFARAKALNGDTWAEGRPVLKSYEKVNELFGRDSYTPSVRQQIIQLLIDLDIYQINGHGAVRRKQVPSPTWAWLRKNRGTFDREPQDTTQSVEILATGRGDWIGWVELAKEPVNETATRMTARVIADVNADIIGIIEVEDRPSLAKFNDELLANRYGHAMVVDGNDERGIDVGILSKDGFEIASIRSNVDAQDNQGTIFSRDCPEYKIQTPSGASIYVLVNHFKSQSGGGGAKRLRQAAKVRSIADELVANGEHVVVLGDLNEGPTEAGTIAQNLLPLFANGTPLVDCYSLANFEVGQRPGTFDSCGIRNRLDYILISHGLQPRFAGGAVFRKGLWGSRSTPPTSWEIYPEVTKSSEQASDHAAIYIDIDL